jgi:CBS domain-containing protein
MFVREIMTDRVKFIDPDATLTKAAEMMDDQNIGVLPVCHDSRMLGILTDRDIVVRSISAGQDPNSTYVREAMTTPVIICFEDQPLEEATQLMAKHQVRRLPVLNRQFSLVGILSTDDLIVDGTDKKLAADVIEALSIPIRSAS